MSMMSDRKRHRDVLQMSKHPKMWMQTSNRHLGDACVLSGILFRIPDRAVFPFIMYCLQTIAFGGQLQSESTPRSVDMYGNNWLFREQLEINVLSESKTVFEDCKSKFLFFLYIARFCENLVINAIKIVCTVLSLK